MNIRENRGITLVMLIVTIVVLLILSGITISMITGGDGVVDKAGNARDQSKIQEEKEQISISVANAMGKSKWGELEEKYLQKEFENKDAKVSKVGNKFKIEYTNGRTYFVDENANVRLKSINELEANEIQEKASTYFGYDVINYEPAAENLKDIEWQLFYAGKIDDADENEEEHIYLISKGCINNEYLPTVIKNGRKATYETVDENGNTVIEEARPINVEGSDYCASFTENNIDNGVLPKYSSSINDNITDNRIKKLIKQYFEYLDNNNKTSNGANIKTTSYLLDIETWKDFTGKNAEYSIGGPTIELLLKSYNKYKNENKLYRTKVENLNGYLISANNGNDYASAYQIIEKDTTDKDNPYCSNRGDYWLASPAYSNNINWYTMKAMVNGYVGIWANATGYTIYSKVNGFRPIICLKADVSLEKTKNSNGNDVFKIIE